MNHDGKSGDDGGVDLGEASPEELAAAARLRDALEAIERRDDGPEETSEEIVLARALGNAFAPRGLDALEHARLVAKALAPIAAAPVPIGPTPRRRRTALVACVSFGGALALAASVLLVIGQQTRNASEAAAPMASASVVATATLVPRSTEPLFLHEGRPLGRQGSARIDRIASARSGEYLQARLARWGAR